MALNWFEALKVYNAGMSSWTIPKKDSPEMKEITKLREGKFSKVDPNPAKMTEINDPKKYGIKEAHMESLREFVKNISRYELEVDSDNELKLKNRTLSVKFPVLPDRYTEGSRRIGLWHITGKDVVIDLRGDTINKIVVKTGQPSPLYKRHILKEAMTSPKVSVRYL